MCGGEGGLFGQEEERVLGPAARTLGIAGPLPIFDMELESRDAADAISFMVCRALAAWLFQAFIVVPNDWKALPAACSASSKR